MSTGTVKVRVRTKVLQEHLEKALAQREERFQNNAKNRLEYEKAQEKYTLAILKLVKSGKGTMVEADQRDHYYWGKSKKKGATYVSVIVELNSSLMPVEPEDPEDYREGEFKRDKEALTQAIRVLKLTEDEFVSASTYNSVAKYL